MCLLRIEVKGEKKLSAQIANMYADTYVLTLFVLTTRAFTKANYQWFQEADVAMVPPTPMQSRLNSFNSSYNGSEAGSEASIKKKEHTSFYLPEYSFSRTCVRTLSPLPLPLPPSLLSLSHKHIHKATPLLSQSPGNANVC